MRYVVLIVLLIPVLVAVGLWQQWPGSERVPSQYNPFAPFDVDDPLTPVTRFKLKALGQDPQRCLAALARAREKGAIDYVEVGSPTIGACQLDHAVRVRSTSVHFTASFLASCPLALSWVVFERQRLQPAACELFGQDVTRVDHVGSFACRNVYHRDSGRRSEHATAEAFDVVGLRMKDGTRLSVAGHWQNEGPRGALLRRAFEGSCDVFGNSLGPEYNAAHRDHFHLGMRGYGLCR